jgi:NAD/NADP transhydrogenase beta subunit
MSHEVIKSTLVPIIYLLSTVLFIFGIKRLSKVKTARQGNTLAAVGMLFAILGALLELGTVDYRWIVGGMALGAVIGAVFAIRVQMTAIPEMVALQRLRRHRIGSGRDFGLLAVGCRNWCNHDSLRNAWNR